MEKLSKNELISKLRKDLLDWEGYKAPSVEDPSSKGLNIFAKAFPNQVFLKGVLHEFIYSGNENAAATSGFIGAITPSFLKEDNCIVWIRSGTDIYPPALKLFGIEPQKIIFIDLKTEKEILWATEESLKCEDIPIVISEISNLSFSHSRRLQLVIEKSKVTGFILRNTEKITSTACAARWQITPLPSKLEAGMPGVGFPRWNVNLLKVKNGSPDSWMIEWSGNMFKNLNHITNNEQADKRKVG